MQNIFDVLRKEVQAFSILLVQIVNMRAVYIICLMGTALWSCKNEPSKSLRLGEWHANMEVATGTYLPFNFTMGKGSGEQYIMEIRNAEERIKVDEFLIEGDSIWIKMPVFEGYIAATFTDSTISGSFNKESLKRYVPFTASHGERNRFQVTSTAAEEVSGVWETNFDYDTDDPYPAKGIFTQEGHSVTGTFRTKTGDYRYLEGVVEGDQLKLSTFDGAHVFLFTATVSDSTMRGKFYSGNHLVENFVARRNPDFELPDADTLTFLKEGYEQFSFSFPDEQGKLISLQDEQFQNKVVLVQIMGTWCPNCLDETRYYVEYLKEHPNPELEIIGLAFEYAKTEEKAREGIARLKQRVGVPYPILLAQIGTSSKTKANEKLPMLNHVLSYPTTIYIDKTGEVRKIHTGFNGPATGKKHEEFKAEFEATLQELLDE